MSTPPFPPDVIRHVVWLYRRFPLGGRVVEEVPAERDDRCMSQGTPQLISTRSEFALTLPER